MATITDILESAFPAQRAFLDDVSRLKVALCSRRGGATNTAVRQLLLDALERPGTKHLYATEKSDHPSRNFVLKETAKALGVEFQVERDAIVLRNGSRVEMCYGKKIAGMSFDSAAVCDASFFDDVARHAVRSALKCGAKVSLFGMACEDTGSLFYAMTCDAKTVPAMRWRIESDIGDWSGHSWSVRDNPHMHPAWDQFIAQRVASEPDFLESDGYKRDLMGNW